MYRVYVFILGKFITGTLNKALFRERPLGCTELMCYLNLSTVIVFFFLSKWTCVFVYPISTMITLIRCGSFIYYTSLTLYHNVCLFDRKLLAIVILWLLTHWGGVTHICVGKLIIIGSDNGLSPDRRQAIIWTNAGSLSIGPLRTYFSEN